MDLHKQKYRLQFTYHIFFVRNGCLLRYNINGQFSSNHGGGLYISLWLSTNVVNGQISHIIINSRNETYAIKIENFLLIRISYHFRLAFNYIKSKKGEILHQPVCLVQNCARSGQIKLGYSHRSKS